MRGYAASDYPELAHWYAARGQTPPTPETFPHVGIFAPGIGVGFLYKTDSALCMLEGFATNPAAPLRARASTMRAIAEALLAVAPGPVMALTRSRGIARLAMQLGLRHVGAFALMGRS